MNKLNQIAKSLRTSAWIVYLLIVFEILYMISPFALYYYSFYKVPLGLLQSSPVTSFLTINILPHFTYQGSAVIAILNFLSWPLIVAGLALFIAGFVQIYWAKFTHKGSVSAGLYNVVRHPQYVALAIVGLGTTIYWPRFIVYIMYATMLFLYYFLAKQEERICLDKYGESYQKYYERTGMFLPKIIEDKLPAIPSLLPNKSFKRVLVIFIFYAVYIAIITGMGFVIKNYALSKINVLYSGKRAIVSTAPLDTNRIEKAILIIDSDERIKEKLSKINMDSQLLYIVPSGWSIPELGIISANERLNYFSNPASHGNPSDFDKDSLIVLITKPVLSSSCVTGKDILKSSLSYIPYYEVLIDLTKSRVGAIKERKDRGEWDGIPVPIY